MTEQEIVQRCKQQLEDKRSISVEYYIKSILKEKIDSVQLRKIKNILLEQRQYIEEVRPDKYGNHRIKFNPSYEEKSWKEKNWFLFEVIRAVLTGAATLIFALLTNIIPQKQKESSPQLPIQKTIVDSISPH